MNKLVILLFLCMSTLHAEDNKITTFDEIITDYLPQVEDYLKEIAEMKNDSYSKKFAISEIQVKKRDVNKDGKVDYYLSVPTFDCGSIGCTGTLYISHKNKYCLAGGITPQDFKKPKIKSLKCRGDRMYYDIDDR